MATQRCDVSRKAATAATGAIVMAATTSPDIRFYAVMRRAGGAT
jgi:hypothetical protein